VNGFDRRATSEGGSTPAQCPVIKESSGLRVHNLDDITGALDRGAEHLQLHVGLDSLGDRIKDRDKASAVRAESRDREAKAEGPHESFEPPVSARKRNPPIALEDFRVRFTDYRDDLANPLSDGIVQACVYL
jgi:hypothetical protein